MIAIFDLKTSFWHRGGAEKREKREKLFTNGEDTKASKVKVDVECSVS